MSETLRYLFSISAFADSIGVTKRTVEGWIARGIIPTVKIGKRRLVNGYALIKKLEEAGDEPCVLVGA